MGLTAPLESFGLLGIQLHIYTYIDIERNAIEGIWSKIEDATENITTKNYLSNVDISYFFLHCGATQLGAHVRLHSEALPTGLPHIHHEAELCKERMESHSELRTKRCQTGQCLHCCHIYVIYICIYIYVIIYVYVRMWVRKDVYRVQVAQTCQLRNMPHECVEKKTTAVTLAALRTEIVFHKKAAYLQRTAPAETKCNASW